jgi:hypothetical protein
MVALMVDLVSRPLVRIMEFVVRLRPERRLARAIASRLFDIVKSECVRSSDFGAARRQGPVEPDDVACFSLRSTRSGAGERCIGDGWLDRNLSRTCEAKVFMVPPARRNRGRDRVGSDVGDGGVFLITDVLITAPCPGHR